MAVDHTDKRMAAWILSRDGGRWVETDDIAEMAAKARVITGDIGEVPPRPKW